MDVYRLAHTLGSSQQKNPEVVLSEAKAYKVAGL
jgi:hypothetical protein